MQLADETRQEAVIRLVESLSRYAGWLGKDRTADAVRVHVQALENAVTARTDASPWLRALQEDVKKLPGGDVRKIFRDALTAVTALLEPPSPDSTPSADSA